MAEPPIERNVWVILIAVILVVDLTIMFALGGTGRVVGLGVASIFILGLFGAGLMMRLFWSPWVRRFPPQPIAHPAQRKSFQSVSLGRIGNFNGCVILTRDRTCVHVELMPPFSWAVRRSFSIPREAMGEPVKRSWISGHATFLIDGRRIGLPAWCADPDPVTTPERG